MERRRLAILCSHIRPIPSGSGSPSHSGVSFSGCDSRSDDKRQDSDLQQNDCIFCQIIRGESPSLKLYEDDKCLCILDTHPLSHGHSLIIPKSHFSSLEATPPSVVAAMCSKVPFIGNAIMRATGCAAGQVIFHTHIHIIPRKERDCLWVSENSHRRPLKVDTRTSELANRVREQLSNHSEDIKSEESSLS